MGFTEKRDGVQLICVTNDSEFQEMLDELRPADWIAFDCESSNKLIGPRVSARERLRLATSYQHEDWFLVGMSLAVSRDRAWYVPVNHRNPLRANMFAPPLEQLDYDYVLDSLRPILETNRIVGHNIQGFDWGAMKRCGIDLNVQADTMILQHLIDERIKKGLKDITKKYLKIEPLKFTSTDFSRETLDNALSYAGPDASNCYGCFEELFELLYNEEELWDLYWKYEQPCTKPLAEMQFAGLLMDEKYVRELHRELEEDKRKPAEAMTKMVEEHFPAFYDKYVETTRDKVLPLTRNVMLQELTIDVLQLPKKNLKKFKLDKEQINYWLTSSNKKVPVKVKEFLRNLRTWRKIHKIQSTYTVNLLERISRRTGRIHPSLKQAGTKSGRLSCENPNGQNIPREATGTDGDGDKIYDVRKSFIAEEGKGFILVDYDAMEMKLTAYLSQCEVLLSVVNETKLFNSHTNTFDNFDAELHDSLDAWRANSFLEPIDIHKYTACTARLGQLGGFAKYIEDNYSGASVEELPDKQDVLGSFYPTITDDERQLAKPVNFGIIYGMTKIGLSNQLGIFAKDAQVLIEGYLNAYPGVRDWMNRLRDQMFDDGYVPTLYGYKRRAPSDLPRQNNKKWDKIKRAGINHEIQGTAATIVKMKITELNKEFKKHPEWGARLVLQVHDELIAEANLEYIKVVGELMRERMTFQLERTRKYPVPVLLTVGVDYKRSLSKSKEEALEIKDE